MICCLVEKCDIHLSLWILVRVIFFKWYLISAKNSIFNLKYQVPVAGTCDKYNKLNLPFQLATIAQLISALASTCLCWTVARHLHVWVCFPPPPHHPPIPHPQIFCLFSSFLFFICYFMESLIVQYGHVCYLNNGNEMVYRMIGFDLRKLMSTFEIFAFSIQRYIFGNCDLDLWPYVINFNKV